MGGSIFFSFSSPTDLRPKQLEPEDSEDELGDGLEDSCSHDENEEEEGE